MATALTRSRLFSQAFLDAYTEVEEDDDLDNLWTTASTFIVLFILSLFYSATVTLIKVWILGGKRPKMGLVGWPLGDVGMGSTMSKSH